MAPKGVWLPRCLHMGGTLCLCPNNQIGRWQCNRHSPAASGHIAPHKNPAFSQQEIMHLILNPVISIDISKSLPRYKLGVFHKKIIRKACKETTQFVQGTKPVLPGRNSLACIALCCVDSETDEPETFYLCFEMSSFYAKGVVVREQFYELSKSTDALQLVEGSIKLNCGDTYLDMFGRDKPSLKLSEQCFVNAYWSFEALTPNAQQAVLREAACCIGLISLILIEPSRQKDAMDKLCIGDPTSTVYYITDDSWWDLVHKWDDRSKIAKGIVYRNNTVEERTRVEQDRLEAIEHLNVVNSTRYV